MGIPIERMKACLNGARSREDHPAVPVTPGELACSAAAAVAAGAEAVHLRPRRADGRESLLSAEVAAAVTAVREACPARPVGVSTGLWITGGDPGARRPAIAAWAGLPVAARPDFASVPAGNAVAAADDVLRRLDELDITAPRLLHGEGPACWPLVAHAGALGLPARIGLEDTTAGPDAAAVSGNAELVRLALPIWQACRARGNH
jgi:uncharacterized protein (DUF849 family)